MKKFLLITYYWPPCGGVSVQRWLKLTKYFPENNWLPTVLTTKNGDYPYIDNSLLKKVPKEVRVVRTKTFSYSKLFRFLLGKKEKLPYASLKTNKNDCILKKLIYFIRIQFITPDARALWNQAAFKAAEKIIRSGMYHAIITTGPPHSTHLIGLKLKNKFDINWVADFRDPWGKLHYHENEKRNLFIKTIDKQIEMNVLNTANAIVTVSKRVSETLSQGRKVIIPNAFDPDDFTSKNYSRTDKFRVKFVGALFDDRKGPVLNTLEWIEEYAHNNGISNIEFSLIGAYDKVPDLIKKRVEFVQLRNIPFVKHEKVIEECVESEVLILVIVQSNNNEGILTYKLFEYIGSKTFILGIGPQLSDAKDTLNKLNAGKMFDYNAKEDFTSAFDDLYKKWLNQEDIKNQNIVDEYSLPSICAKYAELLNVVCGKK